MVSAVYDAGNLSDKGHAIEDDKVQVGGKNFDLDLADEKVASNLNGIENCMVKNDRV